MVGAKLLGIGLAAGLLLGRTPLPSARTAPKAVDHVGIATSDIERSIRFYQDLLGMKLVGTVQQIDDNPVYNHIFGLEKVKAKGASLELGALKLELFEFERPRGVAPDLRQPVNNPRINHICFEVDDLEKEYNRLKAAGVFFHYPPQDFGGPKAVYGRDPDGNVFELLQWSKTGSRD